MAGYRFGNGWIEFDLYRRLLIVLSDVKSLTSMHYRAELEGAVVRL